MIVGRIGRTRVVEGLAAIVTHFGIGAQERDLVVDQFFLGNLTSGHVVEEQRVLIELLAEPRKQVIEETIAPLVEFRLRLGNGFNGGLSQAVLDVGESVDRIRIEALHEVGTCDGRVQ